MQAQQRPPAVSSSFRGRLRLRYADGALDPRIDTRGQLLESGVSELTRPGEGEHRVAPRRGGRGQLHSARTAQLARAGGNRDVARRWHEGGDEQLPGATGAGLGRKEVISAIGSSFAARATGGSSLSKASASPRPAASRMSRTWPATSLRQ